MKKIKFLSWIGLLGLITSCTLARSHIIETPVFDIPTTTSKYMSEVEFYPEVSHERAAMCIAKLTIIGNKFSTPETLTESAIRRAAQMGGDFVCLSEIGEAKMCIPSSYEREVIGINKVSNDNVQVFVKLPENAYEWYVPCGIFFVYLYAPTKSGLQLDIDGIVVDFVEEEAKLSGINIGDKIVAVNGVSFGNLDLGKHLWKTCVGDEMTYTVLRNGEEMDLKIKAFPNG